MNAITGFCKVERTMPDGQRIHVGSFNDSQEARKIIDGLSKYWPGDYRIVRDLPKADTGMQKLSSS